MAYLKPNVFTAKVFNRIAMATGIGGSETMTCTGRKSGNPQQIPVVPVEVDGTLYVVCPRGETQWVRNVRAVPKVSIKNKQGSHDYAASELPVAERSPIIAAYRAKAGKSVNGYWKHLPDDKDHPVFKLT